MVNKHEQPAFRFPPSAFRFSPEHQLLLVIARRELSPAHQERLHALLEGAMDWPFLIQEANRHGLMPLLFHHLSAYAQDRVPSEPFDQLKKQFHANAENNFFAFQELAKILRAFQEKGVPVMPFKGPMLAATVYQNLALRAFVDLDILVRRDSVPESRQILESIGFRPEVLFTKWQEQQYVKVQ